MRTAKNAIKPVYFLLQLLGLRKNEGRRRCKGFPVRICVIVTLLHIYFLHSLLYTSYNALVGLQMNTVFINFAHLIYSFSGICTLDYFLMKKREIYEMIDEITAFSRKQHPKLYLKRLKRESKFCVGFIFLVTSFCLYRFLLYQFWLLLKMKYFKPYLQVYVYGSKYLYNNVAIVSTICALEGMGLTLCSVVQMTIMSLLVMITRILKIRIDFFIDTIAKASLSQICHQHSEMFYLTRRLEYHVDFLYTVWALQWMTTAVVYVPKLVEIVFLTNQVTLILTFGAHALLNFALFVGVSLSFAAMHDAQALTMAAVHRRIAKSSVAQTSGTGNQFLLFKMSSGHLQIKVCKSIVLTRYFILSFYSLILTFVVSAVQRLLKNLEK